MTDIKMNVLNDENSDHTKSTQLDQSTHMVMIKISFVLQKLRFLTRIKYR